MSERSEHELERAMARLKRLGIVLPLAFLAALVVLGHVLVPVLGVTWAGMVGGTLAVGCLRCRSAFGPDRCSSPSPQRGTGAGRCLARSACGDDC